MDDSKYGKAKELIKSLVKEKGKHEVFAYWWELFIEYNKNKLEYNVKSNSLTKRERKTAYLTLVYKQGCLKALEYVLGLDGDEGFNDLRKDLGPND